MRRYSLSLAALTLVLAGSLASVAFADTERQHAAGRADRDTVAAASQANVVADAGIYDGADNFRDSTGHPVGGWGYVIYGSVNG